MIKTEDYRRNIEPKDKRVPPEDVVIKLKEFDSALELIWNEDDNRWEFYRVKKVGIVPEEDLLHWQISAPESGTCITPGILDWLRKYDQTNGGFLSIDDLKDEWRKNYKRYIVIPEERRKKQMEPIMHEWDKVFHRYAVERVQIAVPKIIGMHKKTGKKILAVKKNKRKEKIIGI